MRVTNAQRVIENYVTASFWSEPKDEIRLTRDYEITDRGTIIGKIVDGQVSEDWWLTFLVLTMQDFKSQPNWKKHKLQLARAANENGLYVIFVDQLDNGFGVRKTANTKVTEMNEVYKQLIKLAKYSQDEDLQTAAMCFKEGEVFAASYNQRILGHMYHAEDVVVKYCLAAEENEMHSVTDILDWQMLLEPCDHCLTEMLELGAQQITYAESHKKKWNTDLYIQMTNDIFAGIQRSRSGRKIKLEKKSTKETIKFYTRGGKNDSIS